MIQYYGLLKITRTTIEKISSRFGGKLKPRTSKALFSSASELLRFQSRVAASKPICWRSTLKNNHIHLVYA